MSSSLFLAMQHKQLCDLCIAVIYGKRKCSIAVDGLGRYVRTHLQQNLHDLDVGILARIVESRGTCCHIG